MTVPPKTTPAEWRWAMAWSVAILTLSCIPYLIAAQAAPEGWSFAGILVNPLDGQTYMAKMQQGAAGQWLFHLTYTPEPHAGSFIFTFYLALGHLATLTGWPKILVFHLARLVFGGCLLLMLFRFLGRVTPVSAERRLAFVLLVTASGLGWLGVIFDAFPIDLWVPEAFIPYSLYTNPHFPLAMTLMLLIFDQVINNDRLTIHNSQLPATIILVSVLRTGLPAFLLAIVLPFALLTVWAVLIVYTGWLKIRQPRGLPWAQLWSTLGAGLLPVPLIFYQYWVSITNPILAGWGAQNITPAPPLLDFVIGYGPVGLLALLGVVLLIRQGWQNWGPGEGLVLGWALTTIILIYIPFNLQRRLITGLHIPLCSLAAIGLYRWLAGSSLKIGYQRLIIMGTVVLSALGTLFVWSLPLIGALQSPVESATTALLFIRRDELAAFEWLQSQVKQDDVILASPRVGMFVPGQTGARAFYGHPFETVDARTKKAQAEAFFRGELEFVPRPVDFIIYGPSEQALGRPEHLPAYPAVFSAGEVTVYQVTQ
jgi:hypothetical protein